MMFKFARFNTYLVVALGLLLVAGCASAEKKKKKEATSIELHVEVPQDGTSRNGPVPIYRAKPILINVEKDPLVDESNVESAKVVDDLGGFFIQLKFDWQGTQLLDGATTANRNRRFAVFCKFGKDPRWLAAPLIRQRISDGVFTFTPDADREESDRIVRGLNNLSKEMKKRDNW